MLQYVNGFSCSLNETKDALVIHFIQNEPTIPNEEGEVEVEVNKIASIVMESSCALELMKSLAQLYEEI